MAPPTPPIPPGSPARGRKREPRSEHPPQRSSPPAAEALDGGLVGERDARNGAGRSPARPVRDAGRLPLAEIPFAWQHGRRLLLLDEEARGWTFAELRFDDVECRYVEIRRATFRWPREAAGAVLARGVAFGPDPVERLAGALDRWLAVHQSSASDEARAG